MGKCTLWIQVEENPFSVFSNADESIAYTINVYTLDKVTIYNDIEVKPSAAAYDFPLTQVGEPSPIPQWVTESGFTDNVQYFEKVKFAVEVLRGHATWVGDRVESTAEWEIGIDMLLLGEWKQVHPYREFEGGFEIPFWDALDEAYGHITSSKSAQLRLVLHLWAEGIQRDKVKAAELNQSIEGA